MNFPRLSGAWQSAAAWCSSTNAQVRRLNQAVAEGRKLKQTVKDMERQVAEYRQQIELDQQARDDQLATDMAERNRLQSIIAEQERDLRGKQHEIEQLQSQVQLDRSEITGQTRINTALMANVDSLIAQHVAAASRATSNGHATPSSIQDLL